mgnify:CR=1 FL=1
MKPCPFPDAIVSVNKNMLYLIECSEKIVMDSPES